MAISTYKTFLMKKSDATYAKLVDIKDYPDLGGSPETIEKTTLTDKMKTYIAGLQDTKGLEYTANYDKTDYTTLKALEGKEEDYAVWFGGTEQDDTVTPTGSEGKFKFKGALSVYVTGAGTNEVVEMKITIVPSTIISTDTE